MEVQAALKDISDQWCILLAARMCNSFQLSVNEMTSRVDTVSSKMTNTDLVTILKKGLKMSTTNTPEQIQLMSDTVECLIMQFHNHPNFCKIFSSLMKTTHELINIPIQTDAPQKQKALHTDQIVNEEAISDFAKLECSAFHYLSSFLLSAAKCESINFDPINLDIVNIIFHYLKHDQPNAVRACAGDILSALSSSSRHCQIIVDMFWQQFGSCKKDDDFRNFSSWIDGVQKLHLGLSPEPLEKVSLQFFTNVVENSKKIERGVLRMKFLDSLHAMMATINSSEESKTHDKYIEIQNQVWEMAIKWSTKSKHTSFCYSFLCHMLSISSANFYIKHCLQFAELITKYAKNGDVDMLKLIVEFIKDTPEEYYKSRFDDFTKMLQTYIMPFLFTGSEKKRCPRFAQPDQLLIVNQILVEVGKKQMMTVVDFARTVLGVEEPNNDHKRVRLICIQVLADLAGQMPEDLEKFNQQLFPLLEAVLLGTNPELAEEVQYAIPTFPLIHSVNEEKLNQLIELIFKISLGDDIASQKAMSSFTNFIQKIVTFKFCAKSITTFVAKLLDEIETVNSVDSLHYMLYLNNILTSYAIMLDNVADIPAELNGSKLQKEDWNKMRIALDVRMLMFLLSSESAVSTNAYTIFKTLREQSLQKMDEACGYSNVLSQYISEIKEGSDYVKDTKKIIEYAPEFAPKLFAAILELWEKKKGQLEAQNSSKVFYFMASLISKDTPEFKRFVTDIFQLLADNPSSSDATHALSLVDFALVPSIASAIDPWTKQTGRQNNFWSQTTTIMHSIATRDKFAEAIPNLPELIKLYEAFINKIIAQPAPKTQDQFVIVEKCLRVLTVIAKVSPNHLENVIQSDEASEKFINALLSMASIDSIKFFTNTYPETYLLALKATFEYTKFPVNLQKTLTIWLSQFIRRYEQKEQIQAYIVQVLTVLLQHNTNLLYYLFTLTYTNIDIISSHAILAIANVFSIRDDFFEEYEKGAAILLATVILHISSVNVLSRQAAHKLLCLLLTKEKTIFTETAPRTLVMAITSHSPSGFMTQASHFVSFASQSVKPELAREFFSIFANDLSKMEQPQNPILSSIFAFVPVIIKDCNPQEVVTTALKLTTCCKLDEASTSSAVSRLWQALFDNFKDGQPEVAPQIIELIFNFGLEHDNLKCKDTQVAILILVAIFQVFPRETSDFILPILTIYDIALPDGIENFLAFIGAAEYSTVPPPKEILAANTLSQILLLISDRELFTELFSKKLPALLFYAIINYHLDEFMIGPFRPLLDTLLDAGLFRFSKDNKMFSQNLAALQEANLINCATSLDQQFQIITVPPAKKMLAYDNEAVIRMTTLMCQNDPQFKHDFFNLVLANAVQVKSPDRCIELLIMMIALKDEMSTRSIYYLLLFTLYSLKNNRSELMNALVDNIHYRLISEKCDADAFSREAIPVVIIFLLYISIDFKRSFSIHLMRILTDVCKKIVESDIAESASEELNKFFEKWRGDEFISSLFVKYVADLMTLGDENCKYIIQCLFQLSNLIGIKGSKNNWCLLFAVLIDYVRSQIAELSKRPIKPELHIDGLKYTAIDLAEYLRDTFEDKRQREFVILFDIALYKSFKCNDLHKDVVVMTQLNEFLVATDFKMDPSLTDTVLKIITLVNLTSDKEGRQAASSVIYQIVSKILFKIRETSMSLVKMQPQVVPCTRKVIGYYVSEKGFTVKQDSMPPVFLFQFSATENQPIIDMMWDYIVEKLNQEDEE